MSDDPATFTNPAPGDICQLIPHAGAMCLLDRVERWNAGEIECIALSHTALDNPLRQNDRLPIHAGIEYCAQAIAIHGSLLAGALLAGQASQPRRGYLAVIMNAAWTVSRLDDRQGSLHIIATRQVALAQGVTYAFAVAHEGHTLLTGRTVVALE